MKNKKMHAIAVAVCLGVAWVAIWLLRPGATESEPAIIMEPEAAQTQTARSLPGLVSWAENPAANPDEGIALARARGARMRELIRTNPKQAIHEALTLSEWSKLPPEIRTYVERPFSTVANVEVVIACGDGVSETFITTEFPTAGKMETYVYGRRNEVGSKTGIPVQGIRLGNIGVLREEIFQPLEKADEEAALRLFPVAIPDPGYGSVPALAGGRVFYFKSRAELDDANRRLAALEELPGPDAGAQALFQALEAYLLSDGAIDFDRLKIIAGEAAMEWTGTPRDMYVILVDFPDRTGEPTDPVAFSNSVNTTVSQQIWEMSYEKTHIICTVNNNTYRMPLGNAAYTNNSLLFEHATNAVTGVDLDPYETICVFHPAIDGVTYAGLASVGGRKMWLKSASSRVVTHELGHNYGARHASSWAVPGYNPVDPAGTKTEYGDFTDIMGSGQVPAGHFNAWHKKKIAWFDAGNWQAVGSSGTYRIYRSDHRETTGLLRGLEIDKGDGGDYWVGLRQEYADYETYGRGAYLLWKKPGNNRSFLLDTTPQSADGKDDGGLALGQTYSDTTAGVHITPVARGGQTPNEWMNITVNLGAFPGNNAPSASLSGPTALGVRTSVVYTVTASDVDGDDLAYQWDIGDGLVKPNTPTIHTAWLSGGTATVSCTVSDMKGGTNRVSQTVILSDPLDNWTQRVSGTTTNLNDITVGSGRLVAVGDEATTAYSDDGTSWTIHTDFNVSSLNVFLEAVTYDGSKFIAVGMDYDFGQPGWEQTVYTSSDGTYWTERYDSDSGSGSNIRLYDVAYGGGYYVAVGDNGTIVRSTDAISWSSVTSGTSTDLKGVSYGDGVFVVVGDEGGSTAHVVLTSANGLSWVDRSAGTVLPLGNWLVAVEYCNDQFLAGGWNAEIQRSTNQGVSFSSTVSGSLDMTAFAYGDGIYFSAGEDLADSGADINLLSLDGVNWTALATTSQDDRNAAVFYNGTFITVGDNGAIWQSDPAGSLESGYALWQLENEAALGFDRDPSDDADFDGALNFVEYALGSSATDAGSAPVYRSKAEAGGYLSLSADRSGIKGDIDYTVERTTDLPANDWSTDNTVTVINHATNLTVRSAIPMASQTNEFLRLKIGIE